jgi:hypothetical protein
MAAAWDFYEVGECPSGMAIHPHAQDTRSSQAVCEYRGCGLDPDCADWQEAGGRVAACPVAPFDDRVTSVVYLQYFSSKSTRQTTCGVVWSGSGYYQQGGRVAPAACCTRLPCPVHAAALQAPGGRVRQAGMPCCRGLVLCCHSRCGGPSLGATGWHTWCVQVEAVLGSRAAQGASGALLLQSLRHACVLCVCMHVG